MIANRANDGSELSSVYSPTNEAGRRKPTPPSFIEATLPQWPNVTPFILTRGDQFRPVAPPALDSELYAAAVDEVMLIGAKSSTLRTADQTEIASFWADGGGEHRPGIGT